MGIGITGDAHLLIDGQEAVELRVSSVRDNISAGVTQRRYADGAQRSIGGYATLSSYLLVCQRMTDDTYEWIRQRAGQHAVWRDNGDLIALVTLGNLTRTKKADQPSETAWEVRLNLFLVEADINRSLPTDADLEVIG